MLRWKLIQDGRVRLSKFMITHDLQKTQEANPSPFPFWTELEKIFRRELPFSVALRTSRLSTAQRRKESTSQLLVVDSWAQNLPVHWVTKVRVSIVNFVVCPQPFDLIIFQFERLIDKLLLLKVSQKIFCVCQNQKKEVSGWLLCFMTVLALHSKDKQREGDTGVPRVR